MRYIDTVTKWDPALSVRPLQPPHRHEPGAGGRDNFSRSVALGYTQVLSNTVVNNVRLAVNRSQVYRTHTDMFGPEDVGVNIYSYVPKRMLITITGGFNVNHGDGNQLLVSPQHRGAQR